MERLLTSDELRIAARQAITLAIAENDENARVDLLSQAQRLLREAEGRQICSRKGARVRLMKGQASEDP
jgi:hypothetical protein